jgi:hypothetical protein
MSLNIDKLENPQLRGGKRTFRCPACAEAGSDTKGEHLIINDNGSFGCVVYPKNYEHRKRVFELAGGRTPKPLAIRQTPGPATLSAVKTLKTGILGRHGRISQTLARNASKEINTNAIRTGVSPDPSVASEIIKLVKSVFPNAAVNHTL